MFKTLKKVFLGGAPNMRSIEDRVARKNYIHFWAKIESKGGLHSFRLQLVVSTWLCSWRASYEVFSHLDAFWGIYNVSLLHVRTARPELSSGKGFDAVVRAPIRRFWTCEWWHSSSAMLFPLIPQWLGNHFNVRLRYFANWTSLLSHVIRYAFLSDLSYSANNYAILRNQN